MGQREKDTALARAGFESLIGQARGDARKLAALSAVARSIGLRDRARALANEARALNPSDREVAALTQTTLAADVPEWHFPMVRDQRRNAAYDEALRRAVGPASRVLDIGSGTGLLAMMAARAGAGSVTTCEMNPVVADACEEIVRLNGYADRIEVIAKASGELDAELDLGGRADIIVSEIFSNELLGEAVIPVIEDAIARLLAAGGRVIPSGASVRIALASWAGLGERRLQRISGFDLSPFNRLCRIPYRLDVGDPELSLRSEPADLFSFDFSAGRRFPAGRNQLELTANGEVNGVVQWIRLQLDSQIFYENRPGPGETSCWGCQFYPFAGAADSIDSTVRIHASHNRNQLQIWEGA
jgi:type II protein arginine methyltransferase